VIDKKSPVTPDNKYSVKTDNNSNLSNKINFVDPAKDQNKKIEEKLEKVVKKIEKTRPKVAEEPLDIIDEVNSIDFSCSFKSSNLKDFTLKGGHPDHPETWKQGSGFSPIRDSIHTNPDEFSTNHNYDVN
jgi:hypothetical protein